MPGAILGTGDGEMNKMNENLCFHRGYSSGEDKQYTR